MPREIYCPECGGEGTVEGLEFRCYAGEPTEIKTEEECETCEGEGKITVYTQTEINKAVQDERYSNIVELERLLEKESNEYADMEYIQGVEDCLKAIRARANK